VLFTLIIFCPKTLSMISRESIFQDDIIKLLVNEDGTEDEMYALVGMNTGNTLGVSYLSPTNKIYKSACVYQFGVWKSLTRLHSKVYLNITQVVQHLPILV